MRFYHRFRRGSSHQVESNFFLACIVQKLDPILLTQCHEMLSHFDDSHRKRVCELENNGHVRLCDKTFDSPPSKCCKAEKSNRTTSLDIFFHPSNVISLRLKLQSKKTHFMFNRKRRNRVKILKEQEDNGVFFLCIYNEKSLNCLMFFLSSLSSLFRTLQNYCCSPFFRVNLFARISQ